MITAGISRYSSTSQCGGCVAATQTQRSGKGEWWNVKIYARRLPPSPQGFSIAHVNRNPKVASPESVRNKKLQKANPQAARCLHHQVHGVPHPRRRRSTSGRLDLLSGGSQCRWTAGFTYCESCSISLCKHPS